MVASITAVQHGTNTVTLEEFLVHHGWAKPAPPLHNLCPVVVLSAEMEAILAEHHDMLCPITLNLLVDPVVLHGKVRLLQLSEVLIHE